MRVFLLLALCLPLVYSDCLTDLWVQTEKLNSLRGDIFGCDSLSCVTLLAGQVGSLVVDHTFTLIEAGVGPCFDEYGSVLNASDEYNYSVSNFSSQMKHFFELSAQRLNMIGTTDVAVDDPYVGYRQIIDYLIRFKNFIRDFCNQNTVHAAPWFDAVRSALEWAATHFTYRSLLFFAMGFLDPWVLCSYFVASSPVFLLLIPCLVVLDWSLYWILPVLATLYWTPFVPWVCLGACAARMAYLWYTERRVYESATSVGYTVLYFLALGIFIDVACYFYRDDPRVLFVGVVMFIVYAVHSYINRRSVIIEYTITPWVGNQGGTKGRAQAVRIEVDFPYTMLRSLDYLRCWWIGIPWSTVSEAIGKVEQKFHSAGDLNQQVPVVPTMPVPVVPVVMDKGATMLSNPSSSRTTHVPPHFRPRRQSTEMREGPEIPAFTNWGTYEGDRRLEADLVANGVHPDLISTVLKSLIPKQWEAKGKTKSKRGQFVTLNGMSGPVSFKKVRSPFWMSDQEVDYLRFVEQKEDDYIPFGDWDEVSGYIEVVMVDGSVQRIFYDPDEQFDDEYTGSRFETMVVQPGSDICLLRLKQIRQKGKKPLPPIPESNGTQNVLPPAPKSLFENPLEPYRPDGCFHHPKCRLSLSSSKKPCNRVCLTTSCVHSEKCCDQSYEAMRTTSSRAPIATPSSVVEEQQLVKKKKQYFCPANHALSFANYDAGRCILCIEKRDKESSVPSNPHFDVPNGIIASIVEVRSTTSTGWGQYTDRGVITERHIIGDGTFEIICPFAPAIKVSCDQSQVVSLPNHPELVLIKVRVDNVTPLPLASLKVFAKIVAPVRGAIVGPTVLSVGMLTPKTNEPLELLISAGTKSGMCGLPYIAQGSVVGWHAFGNANKKDNGGFAMTETIRVWLSQQAKN